MERGCPGLRSGFPSTKFEHVAPNEACFIHKQSAAKALPKLDSSAALRRFNIRFQLGLRGNRWATRPIPSVPVDVLPPLVGGGELMEVLGAVAVSASAAFTLGRMSSAKELEGKQRKSSVRTKEVNSDTKTSQQQAVPVPSAEEVWMAAWDGFSTIAERPSPKHKMKPRGDRRLKASPSFSPFVKGQARLGIQALQPAARKRLLLLAMSSIHYSVTSIDETLKRKPSSEFLEAIAQILVDSCSAVTKEWTGRAPDYGLSDSDLVQRLVKNDKFEESTKGMEAFNAWKGLFYLIKEKLPLHAVAVRYLRFGPDQQNFQGGSSDILSNPGTSFARSLGSVEPQDKLKQDQFLPYEEASRSPLKMETSALPQRLAEYVGAPQDHSNFGRSDAPRTLGGVLQQANSALEAQEMLPGSHGQTMSEPISSDLISVSADIIQDMAVCVAEMVATLYLADIHSMGMSGAGLQIATTGWPACLHTSIRNTRKLERFRNQVSLNWWFHRSIYSVVAIFEDYHWLWGFRQGHTVVQRKTTVRRSQDLLDLQRWRLLVSYLLEMLDALEPLGKHFFKRIGALIAFLLTSLLGRAVGLVCKGIRSSLDASHFKDVGPDKTPV